MWDKGLDYENTYKLLFQKALKGKREKERVYSFILLIQLRNGCRISESIKAYKQWFLTGKKELIVTVSKTKNKKERKIIIPDFPNYDLVKYPQIIEINDKTLRERIRTFCQRTFKFNTHSLRYSFITYLLKNGVNPSIISKITKHSKLDYILTYTQEKSAEDVLRNLDGGLNEI